MADSVKLEQLIALNDEMSALIRAGVPLDQGLSELGGEMPGRLGRIASFLGERLGAGESLPQILANNPDRFPRLWGAVVQAGLRAGRLSAALEAMATTGRRIAEVRRAVGLALLYPAIILTLAYCCFLFLVLHLAPVTLTAYESLTWKSEPLLATLVRIGNGAAWWAFLVPLAIVVAGCVGWRRFSASLVRSESDGHRSRSRRGSVLRDSRIATFAENLALLIEHETPLHEALVLAAEASGDSSILNSARELARRMEAGETIAAEDSALAAFPPLLGWLISVGGEPGTLSEALDEMAERYRDRALRRAHWMTVYLPIAITAVVGGSITLLQALAVFLPLCKLFIEIGNPLRG